MAVELREAGYPVTSICRCLGLSRAAFYRRLDAGSASRPQKRQGKRDPAGDKALLDRIKVIKGKHPFWGYRRVRAWLKHREGFDVGYKRVYRLMREHDLLVKRKECVRASRPLQTKPRATRPRQFWGMDMTKFMIPAVGWVYLVIVLDWHSRKVVGFDASLRSRSREWLDALEEALLEEFPQGVRGQGLKLVTDNGCQPTSRSFVSFSAEVEIEQIFTSYNNPKGNAETERFMRTIKEELLWLEEFESLDQAKEAIAAWVGEYNRFYPHSALGYRSPLEYEEMYRINQLERAA